MRLITKKYSTMSCIYSALVCESERTLVVAYLTRTHAQQTNYCNSLMHVLRIILFGRGGAARVSNVPIIIIMLRYDLRVSDVTLDI